MSTQDEDELREKIDAALHVDWAFGTHHGEIASDMNSSKPDRIIVQGYPKGAYHTGYKQFVDNMVSLIQSREQAIKEQTEREARINELTDMLKGFNAGLKGQSAEFRYTMRPIIASIEGRLTALHSTNKSLEEK